MASVKGVLPLSIALHLTGLVLLLIIPLAADVDLPTPADLLPVKFVKVEARVPPAVARVTPAPAPALSAPPRPSFAPTEAPTSIRPEVPGVAPVPDLPGAGDAADLGSIAAAGSGTLLPAPPRPENRAGPVRPGHGVREPRKIVDMKPVYPSFAQQARVEGTVVLEAVLGRDGRVDQVRILRSVPLLDQAAIDAVKRWQYTPTLLNGEPVPVLMTISIRFTLQ